MATMAVVKLERSAEDDDSWLYGGPDGAAAAAAAQKVADPKSPTVSETPVDSRLSADAAVFEPRKQSDEGESAAAGEAPEAVANTSAADEEADAENADDDDSEEDDVQVTIGDIKSQPFDTSLSKFKTPYQQQHSQGSTTTASKPPSKGIDLDAVGTISGVPVYEYDIESIKMEDKPWRKPGADITDYFNYGFNEDTWTKYCEKQRRLRIENSSHKSGNLIFVHGAASHRPEPAKSVDLVNSGGDMNSYSNSGPLRKLNNHQPMHKNSSTIDVIGSTTWDSRRPQPQDFVVESVGEPIEYQQISSVTTMIPMSISIPPPMMNLPPPDFGMPPPPGGMPPRAMAPPHRIGLPPPGLIAPPQILVGPPPGFPPPSLGGPGFEPFFRGGPPPSHDRRPPPGFPDRPPPYGFEGPYGGPPPFGAQPGAPPGWDNRGGGAGGGPGGVGGAGAAASGGDRAPPSWDFRNSPARSDTDLSSSLGDEPDRDRRSSPIKHRPRETYEHQERESRQRERSRSRDRSRLRYVDQDRKDVDHERSRDSKDRGREYERDRGRESYRGRDERDRSRERDRHRRSSRDRRESYDRGRDRERRHHRDREEHHSRRREETEDRHKSKHKKEKKVKQEPMDDGDNASGTPTHSDENAKA